MLNFRQVYVFTIDVSKMDSIILSDKRDVLGRLLQRLNIKDVSVTLNNVLFVLDTEEQMLHAMKVINNKFGSNTAHKYNKICAMRNDGILVTDVPRRFLKENEKRSDSYFS